MFNNNIIIIITIFNINIDFINNNIIINFINIIIIIIIINYWY